jgi:hypothetical protein
MLIRSSNKVQIFSFLWFRHVYRLLKLNRFTYASAWKRSTSFLDLPDFRELVKARENESVTLKYGKYLEPNKWIRRTFRNLLFLGLHQSPPKKILDLGSGTGYFLKMASSFGHNVFGLDRPQVELYDKTCAIFEIPRFFGWIERNKKIKEISESNFDMITRYGRKLCPGIKRA